MNPRILGGYASPQSALEAYSSQEHMLGQYGELGDRMFRYVRFTAGTAIGANNLAQQAALVANHTSQTGETAVASVGTTVLSLTLGATAAAASQYKDGYVKIQSATAGAGQIFRIRDHDAVLSAGVLTAELYDPIKTAITGTDVWSLIPNAGADVVIQPTTITAPAAGVTLASFAAASTSAARYGWVQVRGISSCLIDTTDIVVGSGLVPGAVAGTMGVETAAAVVSAVATARETITTNSIYATVDLKIA